jgi:hypothetical protein
MKITLSNYPTLSPTINWSKYPSIQKEVYEQNKEGSLNFKYWSDLLEDEQIKEIVVKHISVLNQGMKSGSAKGKSVIAKATKAKAAKASRTKGTKKVATKRASNKPKAVAKPKATPKPKAVAKPKAAPKSKPAPKPKAAPKSKPAAKPKAVAKPKVVAKPKAAAKPKVVAKPKADQKTVLKAEIAILRKKSAITSSAMRRINSISVDAIKQLKGLAGDKEMEALKYEKEILKAIVSKDITKLKRIAKSSNIDANILTDILSKK